MRSYLIIIISMLVLLSACGPKVIPSIPPPTDNGGICSVDTFPIDAGRSIQIPTGFMGITTGSNTWIVAWQGDNSNRSYTGTICAPSKCSFDYAQFSNNLPDVVQVDGNCLQFSALADHPLAQDLVFGTSCAPLIFDLYISQQPAIGTTLFPSAQQTATTDVMPFCLSPR